MVPTVNVGWKKGWDEDVDPFRAILNDVYTWYTKYIEYESLKKKKKKKKKKRLSHK